MAAQITNITDDGRRRRLLFGVVTLAGGIAIATGLIVAGVTPGALLIAWPAYWAAALGFIQARDKT